MITNRGHNPLIEQYNSEKPGFAESYHLVQSLLATHLTSLGKSDVTTSPTFWTDLGIFNPDGVFQKLHRCATYPGILTLTTILSTPRQSASPWKPILERLVSNKDTRLRCKKLLHEIRPLQEDILWIWKKRTEEETQQLESCYFTSTYLAPLNRNWLATYIHYILRVFIQPGYTLLSPVLSIVIPFIILRYKMKLDIPVSMYINILKRLLPDTLAMFGHRSGTDRSTVWMYVSTLAPILLYIRGVYMDIKQIRSLYKTTELLQRRMLAATRLVEVVRGLEQILPIPALSYTPTPTHLDVQEGDVCATVLCNFWRMERDNRKEDYLAPLFRIGVYDAMVSVADFLCDAGGRGLPISFAEIEQAPPQEVGIQSTEMWHPALLDCPVVGNSIHLGTRGVSRNILVTGPNAGGKSTFVKTVAVNVLLAQTFGCVCSRTWKWTPYRTLYTHLRISDLEGERSLFQEEMERVRFILAEAPKGRFLATFDELFSSTSALEGMSCAYAVAKTLGQYRNGTIQITTHYPLLTQLERGVCGFTNHQMTCTLDDEGNPNFHYCLQRGVCRMHVALQLLHTNPTTKCVVDEAKHTLSTLVGKDGGKFIFAKK